MTGNKTASVWAVCLLAIVGEGMMPPPAAARTMLDDGCSVATSSARFGVAWSAALRSSAKRQEAAVSRTGRIPGLGDIHAAVGWDNRQQLTLVGSDFEVTRTFTRLTREVTITVAGNEEEPLVIRFGGVDGLTVSRSGRVIHGTADAEGLRQVLGGRAVAAFRERIGDFERRLIAGTIARVDDPHAYGFLLAGAFVASMAGDRAAIGRARDVIMHRIRGKVRSARFDFTDCVTDYELYLMDIDSQRTNCLSAANGRSTWYARAADRLGCEVEFMAQAMAGEGQFLSCTALGAVMG